MLCSVFLDAQLPGAKEVIDPERLLSFGQPEIARLPSIQPRPSELEFLRDLRALEADAEPAAATPFQKEQRVKQEGLPCAADSAQRAQQPESTHPEPSPQGRLTAELLQMLSAEQPRYVAGSRSKKDDRPMQRDRRKRSDGRKRHERHARAGKPERASEANMQRDGGVGDEEEFTELLQPSPEQEVSAEPATRKSRRKRPRRSDDDDPVWQPESEQDGRDDHDRSSEQPEEGLQKQPPSKQVASGAVAAAAHTSKSQYKGVSCHK